MSPSVSSPAPPPGAHPTAPSHTDDAVTLLIARQPIFDVGDRLVAYELRYRADGAVERALGANPNQLSPEVFATTLLGIGVQDLTGGALAFLDLSGQQLREGTWRLFAPEELAIGLPNSVRPTPEVVDACREIVASGYTLALGDFRFQPEYEPLLALQPIVKVDALAHLPGDLAGVVAHLRPYGVRLLAERVESEETHRLCRQLGFELFQGYFYASPETVARREPPLAQLTIMRLLNMLRYPEISDAELDEAFSNDPALCYKLLRLANNAGTGQRGIESIGHAIRLVGRDMLHRWLALLLVSSLIGESGTRGELALQAMTRARFCELLYGRDRGGHDAGSAFTVGLLSLLDAMMRMSMTDVLSHVDLASDVRGALLLRSGPLAEPLALAEANERMHVDTMRHLAQRHTLSLREVGQLQLAAMRWARERLLPGL